MELEVTHGERTGTSGRACKPNAQAKVQLKALLAGGDGNPRMEPFRRPFGPALRSLSWFPVWFPEPCPRSQLAKIINSLLVLRHKNTILAEEKLWERSRFLA